MRADKSRYVKGLVEKIGIAVEKTGFQPAVGRVLACLLVADPPYRTFAEIHNFLGISKSAVSHALNTLMSREIVDYFTKPGDRRRYFQLAGSGLISYLKKKIEFQSSMAELFRAAVETRSDKYPEFNKDLLETIAFLSFMQKEISEAINRWEVSRCGKL